MPPDAAPQPLIDCYPALAGVGGSDLAQLPPAVTVPAGTVLFREGEACGGFPLVAHGEVRVSRESGDGRSLELYRVGPGELCLVSGACLFGAQPLTAHGVATRATTLHVVPAPVFRNWLASPPFRDFVLALFAQRMVDLTTLVDAVAFQRLDARLAAALLGHGPELAITHQALADSLGTVREMVTRLLRRFEREGWVELSRERIRIRNVAALRAHAGAR